MGSTIASDLPSARNCVLTCQYNAQTKSRAKVLYNSLRVDAEPGNVIRNLDVHDTVLSIHLTATSLTNLQASITGILQNIKTISDVIEKFEISEDYSYDYL